MKRFLSILLALALIISLVPVTFATEEESETQVGARIFYSVGTDSAAVTSTEIYAYLTTPSFETTHGFYDFYATNENTSVESNYIRTRTKSLQLSNNRAVVYEVYIPVAGNYTMEMYNSVYSAAKTANVYLSTVAEIEEKGEVPNGTNSNDAEKIMASLGTLIGSYDCSTDGGTSVSGTFSTIVTNPNEITGFNIPEPGYYTIAFYANGGYASVGDFYLTMENGCYLPMTIDADVVDDKAALTIGETVSMSATAYMSDGTPVDGEYVVTYTSSDDNIATVDETGLITAKAYGTAMITASATIDGYTVSGEEKITVNADGIELEYDVGTDSCALADVGFLTALTYDYTNGFYRFVGTNSNVDNGNNIKNGNEESANKHLKVRSNNVQVNGAILVAFEVYVPQKGIYTMKMKNGEYASAGKVEVYITTADKLDLTYKSEEVGTLLGEYICDNDNVSGTFTNLVETPNEITGIEIAEPGYYVLSFFAEDGYGSVGDFTLTNGTGLDPVPMPAIVKVDKTALTLNDAENNTASILGAVVCDSTGKITAESDEATTYISSDTAVVTVSGKTITAVGTGTADITATIGEGGNSVTAKRTITVVDKAATDEVETVQFMATSTLAENASVTTNITGYTVGETTDTIAVGRSVKVTADDVEGYIFRGWKRGSRDNGVWLTTSKTYSFPLLTNTYLTAIYDVDTATDADVNVEFYNFNGQFLASKAVGGAGFGTLASGVTPTLTGYNSFFWTIDGTNAIGDDTVFEKLTRVVARFTDTDSFNVTVPENVTSNKASGTYAYDTEIEMTADNAGFWKVNGEKVAYGTSYTYTVWSEATIIFEEAENDNKPIISIDDNKTDGARMISYDANGADIVEVGILFGANAKINSANSRAVSREAKTNLEGQFTAKPYSDTDVDNATAYLIYNDNGTYRVIYAD